MKFYYRPTLLKPVWIPFFSGVKFFLESITCYKDGTFASTTAKKDEKKESTTKQRKDAFIVEKKDKSQKLKSGIDKDTELIATLKKSSNKASTSTKSTSSVASPSEDNMIVSPVSPNEIGNFTEEDSSQIVSPPVSTAQAVEKKGTDGLCKCPSCPVHQMGMLS